MVTVIALSVVLAGLVPPAAVAAADEPGNGAVLGVSFKARVSVRNPWIVLGDVADLSGLGEARLVELSSLRISHVPIPGNERVVGQDDVRRRLRSAGAPEKVEFRGANEAARVTAAVKALSGSSVVEFGHAFLEGKAARPGAEVAIEDPDLPRSLTVPDVEIELRAETSARRLAGLVPVAVEAWSGGERVARVLLSYRVRATVKAFQSARAVESGAVLVESDLAETTADLADVPEDAIIDAKGLVGLRVLRPTSAGSWFRRGAVAQPLQVKRNSEVTLLARVGPVEARASALAKEAGAAGEIITVMNRNSKKTLRARVVGPSMVEAVIP